MTTDYFFVALDVLVVNPNLGELLLILGMMVE